MAVRPEEPELGIAAPDFLLPATSGERLSLADVMGDKGTVIVFICNHCPYVKAITDRLVSAANKLAQHGIGFAAICSNDADSHPEDSFENMAVFAKERGFTFAYLHDETQDVARAYDAVCTPDFFGLDADGTIVYRGRLDEGRTTPPPEGAREELVEAMIEVARTGVAPDASAQVPSMGCSIKWKVA